ncbi:single-stranded-DNA-specific exonuclease RecJ [bacterium]|nr:single-stranded-DNA-specific exonuclease RecJ [bacterium]
MNITWQIAGSVAPALSTDELRDLLLAQREIQDFDAFVNPRYERDVHDPQQLADMPAAVDRIYKAVVDKEHIVVYGDYDADGVTSTAILVSVLEKLGAQVTPFLPHRSEHGYGLHSAVIKEIAEDIGLVVTVDCGVSNAAEIEDLLKAGVDTVVVDHHTIPDPLPAAHAIIHPAHPDAEYPFPHLCGAGAAWKLAQAILRDDRSPAADNPDEEKWLLDLAALGTIADLVPLVGENRAIVQFGLEVLRRSPRPGVRALLAAGRIDTAQLSAKDLSWRAIPLINAAGRMDHAQPALELLLATDDEQADIALAKIKQLDSRRRNATKQVTDEALAQVDPDSAVAFAHNDSWPAGIVGLVANQLLRKFERPALVMGDGGQFAIGSVRTPDHVNAVDLLASASDVLVKFGGHARAAGFTITPPNIPKFLDTVAATTRDLAANAVVAQEEAAAILAHDLLTMDTAQLVQQFAPFGKGNEEPRFVIKNLLLRDWRPVGKSGDHAKVTFQVSDHPLDGIAFGLADRFRDNRLTDKHVDVLGQLEVNEWRGRKTLQLAVQDIAIAGTVGIKATNHEHARHAV